MLGTVHDRNQGVIADAGVTLKKLDFNALNKTNFRPADGYRSNAGFGTIHTTLEARQVHFRLKLYW